MHNPNCTVVEAHSDEDCNVPKARTFKPLSEAGYLLATPNAKRPKADDLVARLANVESLQYLVLAAKQQGDDYVTLALSSVGGYGVLTLHWNGARLVAREWFHTFRDNIYDALKDYAECNTFGWSEEPGEEQEV